MRVSLGVDIIRVRLDTLECVSVVHDVARFVGQLKEVVAIIGIFLALET